MLFILSNDAFAQQKPIIATCETGQGCSFQLSNVTYEEMDIVEGTSGKYKNMPKDAMIVHAKNGNGWDTYIEEKMSRSELDKFFGGDGYTMIYLFDPKMQPLDGQWKIDIGTPSTTSCYADISSTIHNGLAGLSAGGLITFPKPFNVKVLMNHHLIKWRMISPNQYQGVLDFAGGPTSPMKLVYDVTIVNEKKIVGLYTFTIKVPTKDPCISKIPITFICVKPNEDQKNKGNEIDPFAKRKTNVERIPEEKRTNIERIPEEKKTNVERIPEEKRTNIERIPNEKRTNVERIPEEKRTNIERIPNEKKTKVERIPEEKRTKVERIQ